MTDPETKGKKRKYWEIDPSIFRPGPKDSWKRRYLIEPARSLAKFGFFGMLLIYPLGLVISGLLFGPVFFWGSFIGSIGLIGVVIWKAGYSANFAAWNPDFRRQILGITIGFFLTLGFFLGLVNLLKLLELAAWIVGISGAIIIIAIGYTINKSRQ